MESRVQMSKEDIKLCPVTKLECLIKDDESFVESYKELFYKIRLDNNSKITLHHNDTDPEGKDGEVYFNTKDKNIKFLRNKKWMKLFFTKASKLDLMPPNSPPIFESRTDSSITLLKDENMEYRVEGGEWTSSNTITGLEPGTTYYFEQRYKAKDNRGPSQASEKIEARTDKGKQDPPKDFTIEEINSTEIKIISEPGTEVSYGNNLYKWHSLPKVIEWLSPETEYEIRVRKAENNRFYASEPIIKTFTTRQSDDTSRSPGAKDVNIGTKQEGYYIRGLFLINEKNLIEATGVTEGTITNDHLSWIKLSHKDKTLFFPTKPIKHSVSWDHLNSKGLVDGKDIIIDKTIYKVKLPSGTLTNPNKSNDSDKGAKGSQWNRIIIPLSESVVNKDWENPELVEDDLQDWKVYFDNEKLNIGRDVGSYSWCKEVDGNNKEERIVRGGSNISGISNYNKSTKDKNIGWRPILEVVGDSLFELTLKDLRIEAGTMWNKEDNIVTALDEYGNKLPIDKINVSGEVLYYKPGEYEVSYSYKGITEKALVTVFGDMVDLSELNVKDEVEILQGGSWYDEKAFISAKDEFGRDLSLKDIIIKRNVNTSTEGEGYVIYRLKSGLSKNVKVIIKPTKMKIELKELELLEGSEWKKEDNFTLARNNDGRLVRFTDIEVTELDKVDLNKPGIYRIMYSMDGLEKITTLTILKNQLKINVMDTKLLKGTKWNQEDNFISATDEYGKDLPFDKIYVSGRVVYLRTGEYEVKYFYKNVTEIATVTIFEEDNPIDKSELELRKVTIYEGDLWDNGDALISAIDKFGNIIPIERIKVIGSVNRLVEGSYTLTYDVTNGLKKETTVDVLKSNAELKLKDITKLKGDYWEPEENFISAKNNRGEEVDITKVKIINNIPVNTGMEGKYKVIYQIDNITEDAIITVIDNRLGVYAKNTEIVKGTSWNPKDNFIVARDEYGKDILIEDIIVEGSVNKDQAGTYPITYRYKEASKTVNVKVFEKGDRGSIETKNKSIFPGDEWKPLDNFTSWKKKDGSTGYFKDIKITHDVNTSKPGIYLVSFEGEDSYKEAVLEVKYNQEMLRVRNVVIKKGEKWNQEEGFMWGKSKEGKDLTYKDIRVAGDVNIYREGKYDVKYIYGSTVEIGTVTVI